ncbi:MAG: hypothetical protein R3275_05280 [Saprospiraceae bacterium]|nr:hypothetical protein [Saprospiraceae bacterium]
MRYPHMKWLIASLIVMIHVQANAQSMKFDSVAFYADVMRNAEISEHRLSAAKRFEVNFVKNLESKTAFSRSFDKIQNWVSFIYPPDSSFRVISWQVDGVEDHDYRGIIQMSDGDLIRLRDASKDLEDVEFAVLSPDRWYGAIYYDLVTVDSATYILLGYNALDKYQSRKVAEVIHFEEDQVEFGKEIFYMDQDSIRPTVKTRIVLEYSELAAVRLTYDPQRELIFFDNLIPVESYEKEGEIVMVQDGSYSGFSLVDDKWIFIDKIFDTKVDEPPRERPALKEDKDILGRPGEK